MKSKILFSFAFFLIIFYTSMVLALEVYTDKTVLGFGERLNLTIKTESLKERPDLSPLQKDFNVIGTSSSSQTSIVNGKRTSTQSLNLALTPKRKGFLEIPSLKLGKELSLPITVEVTDIAPTAQNNNDYFMTAKVDNDSPLVQQQVIYTVKIYDSSNLTRIIPITPDADDLHFVQLGDYSQKKEYLNNRQYDVYIFKYAVFPQKSGEIIIPPAVAEIITQENLGSSLFDFFNQGLNTKGLPVPDIFGTSKTSRIASKEQKLIVKPKIDNAQNLWLPAKDISLYDAWKPNPPVFKIGEPASRIIAIKGQGVRPEQLPDFADITTSGLRIYPDKANSETLPDNNDVSALKQQTLVYIPEKAGKAIIPEISILWWDTINNEFKTAILPEKTIEVEPDDSTNTLSLEQTKTQETKTENILPEKNDSLILEHQKQAQNSIQTKPQLYSIIYIALGIVLGFALAVIFIKINNKNSFKKTNTENKTEKDNQLLDYFVKACDNNDARQARDFMLKWAKIKWRDSPPYYLKEIASRLNDKELEKQLETLDQSLYNGGEINTKILKNVFVKAIKKHQKEIVKEEQSNHIPDLYP